MSYYDDSPPIPTKDHFQDEYGSEIKVGTRCIYGCPDEAERFTPRYLVTVFEITEPDGDVDDYGRSIFIPPRVRIRFDDTGEEDSIQASHNYHESDWDTMVFDVSDLQALTPEEAERYPAPQAPPAPENENA